MMRRVVRRLRGPATPATDPFAAMTPQDAAIVRAALPYTMTGPHRLQALVDAVRYCVARDLPGAFAECGVWRGGSVVAMILTLQELGVDDRDIHLYDTFEGMTEPTEHDTSPIDPPALSDWREARQRGDHPWGELFGPDVLDEDDVRSTVLRTGYPAERIHFVRGRVEDTIPAGAPDALALLRLDTDWYESTRHELEHLYPRLVPGGVLLIDDYGYWEGSRKAVEEFLDATGERLLLLRMASGRVAVKP